jgi:hypothetical protein
MRSVLNRFALMAAVLRLAIKAGCCRSRSRAVMRQSLPAVRPDADNGVRGRDYAREKAARCPGERPSRFRRLAILRGVRRVGAGGRWRKDTVRIKWAREVFRWTKADSWKMCLLSNGPPTGLMVVGDRRFATIPSKSRSQTALKAAFPLGEHPLGVLHPVAANDLRE